MYAEINNNVLNFYSMLPSGKCQTAIPVIEEISYVFLMKA